MTYLTTPRFGGHPRSIQLLQHLMSEANRSNRTPHAVRCAIDGDSRMTVPGGAGQNAVDILAWESWKRFGNMPSSQLLRVASAGSGGGNILASSASGAFSGTHAPGDTATARFPYNAEPANDSRRASNDYGVIWNLNHRWDYRQSTLTEIDVASIEYIQRSTVRWNTIMPHTLNQHNQLLVTFLQAANATTFYFGSALGSPQVVDASATVANDSAWSVFSGALNWGASTPTPANLASLYGQITLKSNSASIMSEVGPVWFSSPNTRGIEWHSLSAGGKKMADAQLERGSQGDFCTAFDPDIWWIACGANDSGNGVTANQFKADCASKIAWRKDHNPNALFVLVAEYDRTAVTSTTEWNLYADKLYELAMDSANQAVFINRRRILEEVTGGLWNASSGSILTYVPDGVHPSDTAARLIGKYDIDSLFKMGAFSARSSLSVGSSL